MEKLNPEYEVVLLNDESIKSTLGFEFNAIFEICNKRLTLENKADLLRLYLLSRYGGAWVDATTFCVKPLEEWLPYISNETDFLPLDNIK
ncbi:MAG: capsular polysaccharide synthesis protein [Pseudomonadota bacterium]